MYTNKDFNPDLPFIELPKSEQIDIENLMPDVAELLKLDLADFVS